MFELIDIPELRELQQKVAGLERERNEAQVQAGQLRVRVGEAHNEDLNAEALALNAGKKVPRPKAPELEAQRQEAERTLEVLERRLSLAQAEVSKYIAAHHEEIHARLTEAEQREAAKVAEAARQTLADLSRYWKLGEDRKTLKPYSQVPPDENAPAQRLSTTVIGVRTQGAGGAGPQRGEIEGVLSHLASLASPKAEGAQGAA
jgi:hypothetical protein